MNLVTIYLLLSSHAAYIKFDTVDCRGIQATWTIGPIRFRDQAVIFIAKLHLSLNLAVQLVAKETHVQNKETES